LRKVRVFLRKNKSYISLSVKGRLLHVITTGEEPETSSEKQKLYDGMCG